MVSSLSSSFFSKFLKNPMTPPSPFPHFYSFQNESPQPSESFFASFHPYRDLLHIKQAILIAFPCTLKNPHKKSYRL
jgi:hypothetical protein